ncbi:MAG: hypothetical protein U1E55_03675 [Paracoccus sp. (in: a-proteobacteria)]
MDHLIGIGSGAIPATGTRCVPSSGPDEARGGGRTGEQIQHLSGDENRPAWRSWTVPVLTVLQTKPFTEIKALDHLDALSQSLQSMEERSWICRSVDDMMRPPKPIYSTIHTGAMITKVTGAATETGYTQL